MAKIYFDMDGVLAKYLFWKPYEALFEEFYFASLPPQLSFVNAVKELNKSQDVYILSSYLEDSKYALEEKRNWLREQLPEISEDHWVLIPCGVPKGNYVKSEDDILIDDWGENCRSWMSAGGRVFKVSTGAEDAEKERGKYDYVLHPEMTSEEITNSILCRIYNDSAKKTVIREIKDQYGLSGRVAELVYRKGQETSGNTLCSVPHEFAEFAKQILEANREEMRDA